MALFKIWPLGVPALLLVWMWWTSLLPPWYDGLVNGVTMLQTHTIYVDGKAESQAKISTWRIKFPKGFGRGSDGSFLFHDFDNNSSGRGGALSTSVGAWLKDGIIVNNPEFTSKDVSLSDLFTISINNMILTFASNPSKKFANEDYCLSEKEAYPTIDFCPPVYKRCQVYISYHGWDAHATVPLNTLYKDPKLVCSILRKTLDAWTLSIDDLRQERQQGQSNDR